MFIFVVPMYSKQELNADSNYVVYTALIRAMAKSKPHYHFIIPFPDAKSGYKYENDGFFKLSNVTRIPQRIATQKKVNAISYDASFYLEIFRTFGIDVIWANLVECGAALLQTHESSYELVGRPVLCVAHNYVIHKSLPYPWDSMKAVALHQIMGAIAADTNVFNSRHCEWMFYDTAQQWINPKTIDAIKQKSVLINYGTLEDDLRYSEKNNDIPIIAYNHRLQGYKNYKITFAMLNELYQAGYKFKVRYMNNTSEHLSHITDYPFLEVVLCANRAQYLVALRGCDLNITNSQHETFCIAAIESMALGQPLIAPNAVTFPEITGGDYPFLFSTPQQQKQMTIEMITSRELRQKWGRILSEYVIRNYNTALWAEKYSQLWQDHNGALNVHAPDDAEMAVKQLIVEYHGKTIHDFTNKLYRTRVNGRSPFSNQSYPLPKIVRMVRQFGGTIRMIRGDQVVYSGLQP